MKKKYFLLFIVALLLSMLMVACGGEQAEPVTDDQDETADVTPETDDAVTDATGEEEEARTAIVVHGDTINSSQVEDAVCVVNSRFEKGQMLVFRAVVVDAVANEELEDAEVKVVLETGEEIELAYTPHGEEETMLYAAPWTIPDDFMTGTVNYQIIATVDGNDYTYEPFNVGPSLLTIIDPS